MSSPDVVSYCRYEMRSDLKHCYKQKLDEIASLQAGYEKDIETIKEISEDGRKQYGAYATLIGYTDMEEVHKLIHKFR